MDLITILITASALSMDSLSVAVATGCRDLKFTGFFQFKMAIIFALFQSLMPILGFWGGIQLKEWIADLDHWFALVILAAIGLKMIIESRRNLSCEGNRAQPGLMMLCGLALATSIDALAVGVGFAFLGADVIVVILLIGTVTFMATLFGIHFGKRLGPFFGRHVEMIGGLVLIAIGVKIVIEHLSHGM